MDLYQKRINDLAISILVSAGIFCGIYLYRLFRDHHYLVDPFFFWATALLISAGFGLAIYGWLRNSHARRKTEVERCALEERSRLLERQIQGLARLNHDLADIEDEEALMNNALRIITEITGSTAASFISLDEWGQTLPAYAQGSLPEVLLKGWAEYVISERTKHLCRVCIDLEAMPGKSCPLLQGPFLENFAVYCLPLQRGEHLVGMLNIYYPVGQGLTREQRSFIQGILNMLLVAIQAIRLHNQERSTLQYIQMMRFEKMDFSSHLTGLLHSLRQAVDADYACLQVRASESWQSGFKVEDGKLPELNEYLVDEIIDGVYESKQPFPRQGEDQSSLLPSPVWAVPLTTSENLKVGVLMVAGKHLQKPDECQQKSFDVIASYILLMLETERYLLSMEYRLVIQERKRLAREIHDSLAQTLAFLKLQTAQMQGILRQQDYERLENILEQNYEALSEAYLDARQAIDHLRIKPEQGLIHWLEEVVEDFEEGSGILVEKVLIPPSREIPPEIQAQLIRIIQEAFNNIRKHSGATKVVLAVKAWDGDVVVEVRDDGKGFQPMDVLDIAQHGLKGMRERAELIGADFQIESQSNKGTVVRLRLPPYEESKV